MSTCNRLDLESLESSPTMPKNFPGTDHWHWRRDSIACWSYQVLLIFDTDVICGCIQFAKSRVTLVKHKMFTFKKIEDKLEDQNLSKLEEDRRSRRSFYRVVMLFLFLFSVTIVACCVLIRCWEFDQAQSKLMLCAFTVCWEKNVTVSMHKF